MGGKNYKCVRNVTPKGKDGMNISHEIRDLKEMMVELNSAFWDVEIAIEDGNGKAHSEIKKFESKAQSTISRMRIVSDAAQREKALSEFEQMKG